MADMEEDRRVPDWAAPDTGDDEVVVCAWCGRGEDPPRAYKGLCRWCQELKYGN